MGSQRMFANSPIILHALFSALLLSLCATPAYSAGEGQSTVSALQQTHLELFTGFPSQSLDSTLSEHVSAAKPWVTDFVFRPSLGGKIPGSTFVQRSIYHTDAYSLCMEMGSMREELGVPFPFLSTAGKGARFSLKSAVSGNSLLFTVFTATGNSSFAPETGPRKAMYKTLHTGAFTQLGFLSEKISVQASIVTAEPASGTPAPQAANFPATGKIARFSTRIDPFAGTIVADSGINLSIPESAARYNSATNTGYEFRLRGKIGGYGYDAACKRPIAEYSLLRETVRRKDSVRYSLSSVIELPSHFITMNLIRDEMSTIGASSQKAIHSFKGVLAYSYKGLSSFPLGIEYRQLLNTARSENIQGAARRTEEDAISGNIGYRAGILDWGLQGKLRQQSDPVSKKTEQVETLLSFSPHMIFTTMTVLPCLSVRNSKHLITGNLTDTYAITIGTKGHAHVGRVEYELHSGFSNSLTKPVNETQKNITSNLKIAIPLARWNANLSPLLVFKTHYNAKIKQFGSKDEFSFLVTIDNG